MIPRTDNQKHLVVVRVLWLDGFINGDWAVDILLVPQAMDEHDRHPKRLRRQDAIDGLVAPEAVVGRMFEELPPEPELFETAPPSELTRRDGLHEHVVVVKV